MKIEVLRLANLNSLRGEQEIRFDHPPLADSGLFAIVGETGAGKTTLLDAITLALYGQIDREKESKGGGSRIMTWGEGWCYAEVEFTTDGGRFLCRWERSRAYKKPEGKLQAADHKLSVWDEDAQNWKFLTEKVSDTQRAVPEVSGLNYDRFTRSVMLPQGAFARFLLADENERADLLEQITGTGIYRQISIAAYERHKLAGEELRRIEEQLSNLRLLSKTEKEVITTSLSEQQKELEQLTPQLATLGSGLKLYQRQRDIAQERTKLQNKAQRLQLQKEQQAAERKQLAASDQLSPVAEQLRSYQELRKQLAQQQGQLQKINAQKASWQADLKAAEAALKKAEEQQQSFQEKLPAKEKKLDEALALESQVKEISKEAARLSGVKQSAEKLLKTQLAEGARLEKQLAQLRQNTSQLKGEIGQLLTDDFTVVALDDLPLRLQESLATSLVKKESLERQLQQYELLWQIAGIRQKLDAFPAAISKLGETLAAKKQAEKSAEEEVATQSELLQQLRQSKQLEAVKSSLSPGEACPVCGAEDHPALAHWRPPSEDLLAKQRQKLAAAEVRLTQARKDREAAAQQLAAQQQAQSNTQEQLAATTANWQQKFPDAPLLPSVKLKDLDDLAAQKALAQKQIVTLQNLQQKAKQLLAQQSENALRRTRQQLLEKQQATEATLQTESPKLATIEQQLQEKRAAIADLLGNNSVAEAKAKLKAWGEQCQQQLDEAKNKFNQQKARQGEAESQIKLISAEIEKLEAKASILEAELQAALKKLNIADIPTAHAQLLPNAHAQELREKFAALDQELHALGEQLTRWQAEQEASATILSELPSEAELQQQFHTLEATQKELYEKSGALRQQILTDMQNRAAAGDLTKALEKATQEKTKWATLDELIGSAKGDRFSRFAQSLTLERLVAAANEQLIELLDGRYRIDRAPSVYKGKNPLHLGLEIIDTYQADNRRDTRTLSGGESFLVSLALALGLSDLAGGQTKIRSLFIDEGFGSLDQGLLDTVIDSLENLRAQGKTIGLISHVKALRERIHHKIIVEKRGDGFSGLVVI